MKIIYGIDITKDKYNDVSNEETFIIRKVDDEQEKALEVMMDSIEKEDKKGKLPLGLEIVKCVAVFIWTVILIGIIRAIFSDTGFLGAYKNAPYLFYIALGCFIIWVVLILVGNKRRRKALISEDLRIVERDCEAVLQESKEQLKIPFDAIKMDILACRYKINNDIKKIVPIAGVYDFMNFEKSVYLESDLLCLADAYQVLGIPLVEIKEIRVVKKRKTISQWNKDTDYTDLIYHNQLMQNQFGIVIKEYYSLIILHEEEEYQLDIPNYEINQINNLLDLPINADF